VKASADLWVTAYARPAVAGHYGLGGQMFGAKEQVPHGGSGYQQSTGGEQGKMDDVSLTALLGIGIIVVGLFCLTELSLLAA
jgi:hypothetical protein